MPYVPARFAAMLPLALALLCAFSLWPALGASSPPGPVTVGNARFTVITPTLIRLEYQPQGRFVDAPSLFAVRRAATGAPFTVRKDGSAEIVDTGRIQLTYTPDGRPFSPANLRAVVHKGTATALWTPGLPNTGNLGGTLRTLDGVRRAADLGEGLLSRDGWYLLDDSRRPLLTADWVQSRPADAGSDWYLFGYGDDYRAALKSLAAVGGPVPLPRRYALGAWYSRYWAFSSSDYRQVVAQYGQHDFPLDNIVLDMDWHKDGWTGWSWNRKLLPDAETLLPWLHAQGLHDTLNLHPAEGVGPQEDQYAKFMRDMGADPATRQTLPFDAGSKLYMDTLTRDVLRPLAQNGVDFWWLDWQQGEYTKSIPDLTNLFWLNTLLYQNTAQGNQRGLSFSRWAGWGDHRHPIHFSGDADTGFPMLAFEVPFTATAGNVGCFFWSHDIGGHMGGRNEESYARWVQFGAVSPVLRSHSTRDPATDRRPWNYPLWAENSMRIAFHLRDTLFPYLYTSAAQTCRDTVPLIRPLYIDNPHTEPAYHNAQEFMLGDHLLAAPIVSAGVGPGRVGAQTVWFPGGTWYNAFTGERFAGGTNALVAADINEFPLYARGGVPIPMQPYTPRMATTPLRTLRVRCWPGADGQTGRASLYEDDGVSSAYAHGQFATTPLSCTRRGNVFTVTIGAAQGHYAGQPMARAVIVELPDTAHASRATLDGKAVAFAYDPATWTNTVTVSARKSARALTLVVSAAPGGWDVLHQSATARRMAGVVGMPAATLQDALAANSALAPAQQQMAFAVMGVGFVPHNDGTTLFHGAVHDYFYAPLGTLDNDLCALTSNSDDLIFSVPGEQPSLIPRIETLWRTRPIARSQQVSFRVGGREYRLPAALPAETVATLNNITRTAHVTASGSQPGYSPEGAVDGLVGGYPDDPAQEWSAGANAGAALTLTWDTPQTIDHIALYDRPNTTDQITAGIITFSDGSTLPVGALPNDANTPLDLHFSPKTIKSLTFQVSAVRPGTQNAGLAEIAVFSPR